jgi:hypothetical protein
MVCQIVAASADVVVVVETVVDPCDRSSDRSSDEQVAASISTTDYAGIDE